MEWWWDLLKAMDAHEGQAAWAQFAGATLAVALALHQGASAARRDKARDRAAATAAYTLVSNAGQVVAHMNAELAVATSTVRTATAQRYLDDRRLDRIEEAIIGFDTTRLPEDVFVTGIDQAQTALREFRQSLEAIVRPPVLLIVRPPEQAAQNLQLAASIMVPTLVLLGKGAKLRAFRQRLGASVSRFLPRRPTAGEA